MYSVCLCQNENHLLSAGRMIKMWDLKTKTVVKVCYISVNAETILCISQQVYIKADESID